MSPSAEVLRAAQILQAGGLVALPTETVYGLGANALNLDAVARVFDVKGRPRFDPLIVHVAELEQVFPFVVEFPQAAQRLAEQFWPGPLTLVLPKTDTISDLVTAAAPTVAIRIPDHPISQSLLKTVQLPIAAPSANLFGRISPTTADHVREQLGDRIDYILDGGPCRVGVESTVLQITADGARLLRPGGVTLEAIEAVIGPVELPPFAKTVSDMALASPGMLPQHYAPRTRLVLANQPEELPATEGNLRVGLLAFRSPPKSKDAFASIEILSATGDLREAAARFFAALRRLDAAGLDLIVAQTFPEEGLGRALNDRLRRAAT